MKLRQLALLLALMGMVTGAMAADCPSGEPPHKVHVLGKPHSLWQCGGTEIAVAGKRYVADFDLIDPQSQRPILHVDANAFAITRRNPGRITVTEYVFAPTGPMWTPVARPYRRHLITANRQDGVKVLSEFVFIPPTLRESQFEEVQELYQIARQTRQVRAGYPALLVWAAASGDSRFEGLLRSAPADLGLSGEALAEFQRALTLYCEFAPATAACEARAARPPTTAAATTKTPEHR